MGKRDCVKKPVQQRKQTGRKTATKMLLRLQKEFPEAKTALSHRNPFELLIATILSAQCTDERVNIVTQTLFQKYTSPSKFAEAVQEDLERDIHSTGFFRMKAKNIIHCSTLIVERHGGRVPPRMADLVALPGVGRKTANVVLSEAFGIVEGVVVDTHVHRLSRRMGFTAADTPEEIERHLMQLFPKEHWASIGRVLILHGRKVCKARKPACTECVIAHLCPSAHQ